MICVKFKISAVSHIFAKVASEFWLEASHESALKKIAKAKCNLVSQAAATWQDMANRGKRVHFCNDGEEGDEPEEAYEVYEVYDYITCVISKMVGGLRRKKKLCRGREQMGEVDGTVRPQAAAVRN